MPRNYELTRTIASVHRYLTARDESPPEVKEILVEANGLHSEKILPNAGKLLVDSSLGGPWEADGSVPCSAITALLFPLFIPCSIGIPSAMFLEALRHRSITTIGEVLEVTLGGERGVLIC